MANFIDRRLNPKDKSLSNRRRLIRRYRDEVKEAVRKTVQDRKIADVDKNKDISISTGGTTEPYFHHADEGGRRERVLPGNKHFRAGDKIDKPPSGGGKGRKGSNHGDGEDEFGFVLKRDEMLDIWFEDLALPDMVKEDLQRVENTRPHRAGISTVGSPGNLNVMRTMRHAFGRRLALRRPSSKQVRDLREQIFELEKVHEQTDEQRMQLRTLQEELEKLLRRQKVVPFIDPLDVRYNYFEQRNVPNANAVMFCLMDVSASMGEREKELAKQFFVLLHLFLTRNYEKVELVFIRHTHYASEVDEDTFFHARDTGGTVVSTALLEMRRIINERYPASKWNIYAAQASDGDNYTGDSNTCAAFLHEELMRLCQYFAYVEIIAEEEARFVNSEDNGTELWLAYRGVAEAWPNFAMKRVASKDQIWRVFRELFATKRKNAAA